MRDLVMLFLLVVLVVMSLRNAFGVYILWGWSGLLGLGGLMYGFMQSFQFVLLFASISLVLVALGRDPRMGPLRLNGVGALFLLFGLHAVLVAVFAFDNLPRNVEICLDLLKTLLFCILMPKLVTSRFRAHVLVLMVVLALAFHGSIEGLKFIASGGAHLSQGSIRLGDRNHFAVLVVACMPLVFYLYQYSKSRIAQWLLLGTLLICTLSVVTTYSRGGLVALLVMAVWFVLRSRKKVLGLVLVAALGLTVVVSAPDAWLERMSTIKSAEGDESFIGRVKAWKRASAIAVDNPVFGGGFHSVQSAAVLEKYRYSQGLLGFIETTPQTYPAAAHSIYFEVLGDMGFGGLFIFIAIMLSPFIVLRRMQKQAKKLGTQMQWAVDLGSMITMCMMAYLAGGASISAAYFELPYVLVMFASVLGRIVQQAATSSSKTVEPVGAARGAGWGNAEKNFYQSIHRKGHSV